MSVFVTQGGGGKKWQNSVHVVVECPQRLYNTFLDIIRVIHKNSLRLLVLNKYLGILYND